MSVTRLKLKGRKDSGCFVMLTYSMMEHPKYISLSHKSRSLLLDISHKLRWGKEGIKNNGDLSCTEKDMAHRGWKSGTLFAARKELENTSFLKKTRQGGKNSPTLYALTWLPINESDKYDAGIKATKTATHDWKCDVKDIKKIVNNKINSCTHI